MAQGGPEGDGVSPDLPWAAVFDPAVNVRALGEIQARGFRAASELVNRFVRIANDVAGDASAAAEQEAGGTSSASAGPDADRIVATWQRLTAQLTGSLRDASATGPEQAIFDFVAANARGRVALEAAGPGSASAEVWLHNSGAVDLGKARLRCSDLMSHEGAVIPLASVRFEPDAVPMVARSSRGVTVEVNVDNDIAPGCYRGTLFVDGYGEVWLPVELTVQSPIS